jgi:microsomal dipeptidase-like Zn-dependent dipeptidase
MPLRSVHVQSGLSGVQSLTSFNWTPIAAPGAVVTLVNNCSQGISDCTWKVSGLSMASGRDPGLWINAYGGARNGTIPRLVNNCAAGIPDCLWNIDKGMISSATDGRLALNAYGGAKDGGTPTLVDNCTSSIADCRWTLHKGTIASDTNATLLINAYGGARDGGPLRLVANCPAGNPDCAWLSSPLIQGPGAWTASLRGIADVHNHQFANLAFGGRFVVGSPAGAANVSLATGVDHAIHGFNHVNDVVGNLMDGRVGMPESGFDGFTSWPTFADTDHQKAYKDWLFNAVQGGLRLMVMFAVDSPQLCHGTGNDGRDCDDEFATIQMQLQAAVQLQDEIDAQNGGAGKGWYRIVKSPAEARAAVAAGKLAVVLGVETLNSLGTTPSIQRLAALRNQFGVRHIFPIHQADNYFGGASYFEERLQRQGNVPGDVGGPEEWITRFATVTTDPCPQYEKYGRCNAHGLSDGGKAFLPEIMLAGVIFDVDHMSEKAMLDAEQIAERYGYPVISSHAGFNAVAHSGATVWHVNPVAGDPLPKQVWTSAQDHEGQLTEPEYRRVVADGGLVGVMLSQGRDLRDIQTYARPPGRKQIPHLCGRTSETFTQAYLYAVDHGSGQAVAIGTDLNTPSLLQPGPRFGTDRCPGRFDASTPDQAPALQYPFLARASGASMDKMRLGSRLVDFNTQGFATIGQLPDLIADMEALGVDPADLDPLFHSAEAYIKMWEKAEAASRAMPSKRMGFSMTPAQLAADKPQTFTVSAADYYWGNALQGDVWVDGNRVGTTGTPITMTFKSTTIPPKCVPQLGPDGKPVQDCEPAQTVPPVVQIVVKSTGYMDGAPQSVNFGAP